MSQEITNLGDLEEGDEVRRADEPDGPTYTVVDVPEPNPLSGEVEQVSLGPHGTIGAPAQWALVDEPEGV